ncbi:MAG: adenylyl-sulfate kinase [Bacillota bacterium]
MAQHDAQNIIWHQATVNRADRERLLGQKGILLWFTGLSGSGKSTLANAVEKKLHLAGQLTYSLDGDNIRHGLNQDLGFSLAHRKENIRRIGEVAKLFVDTGVIVLAAFISPLREDREQIRHLLGEDFVEVYVKCALKVCESRDPKNLYKQARAGEIKEFTGITSPYEEPENPQLTIQTDLHDLETCVDVVIDYLSSKDR